MCGIIGIIGKGDATEHLLGGLQRLEYRGYDSAGIATIDNGKIDRRRAEGKLDNLIERLKESPLSGTTGIGHTRWATHGVPNEMNAHPHATNHVALVHNGIIENFQELREQLGESVEDLASDTDTEVVVHLITQKIKSGMDAVDAVRDTLQNLEGAFALAIIFAGDQDLMIGARRGSPLAVGYGDGEMYLGSDALALAPLTKSIMYLDDGDWVVIRGASAQVYDQHNNPVERAITQTELSGARIGKDGYRHYMQKEIFEQPQVIGDTLQSYINASSRSVRFDHLGIDPNTISKLTMIACGTSYIACLVAKYWLESIARIPVEVDIASEFRYREAPMDKNGAALFISQSGETVDTLAALRYAKSQGQKIISIVNVPESSIARESDVVLRAKAGPEIGVASTKAFTTQLTVLSCLCLALAKSRGAIDDQEQSRLVVALTEVPSRAQEILNHDNAIKKIAADIMDANDVLYLGRGTSYGIAMEGALKLKEISYIHAEGYAAGEMKHGPIALIDEDVPVIALAPSDKLFDKTASNIQEVMARGGKVIVITDQTGADKLQDGPWATLVLPEVDAFVSPILYTIPVQMLAYHVAVLKGTDVDQPRNLAKSVTVE